MSTPAGPSIQYLWSPSYLVTVPAQDWAGKIQGHSDPAITKCFVTRIEHLKCQNGKEHEFLLITVQYGTGNHSSTTQLVTDRCVKDTGNDGTPRNSKRSSQILITGSFAPVSSHKTNPTVSSQSLPDTGADDRVYCGSIKRALTDLQPYSSLRTLKFQDTLPVTSLAVLLTIVCLEKPDYRPDESQCYWYANTIYAAASLLFHGSETVDAVHGKSRGTYMHIPISQSDSVATVAEKCRDALEKYKETTEATRNMVSIVVILHCCYA